LVFVVEFKKALHRTRASPFAHQLGVDGAAEDGVEGTDEDGLAGPGLAGDDVEAGAKFDHRFFDEGKVLDVEASQHRAEAEGLLLVVSLVQKGEAELALGVGGEDLDALAGLVEPLAADARGGDAFFKYFEGLFEFELAASRRWTLSSSTARDSSKDSLIEFLLHTADGASAAKAQLQFVARLKLVAVADEVFVGDVFH
jgi:hypothetical protein